MSQTDLNFLAEPKSAQDTIRNKTLNSLLKYGSPLSAISTGTSVKKVGSVENIPFSGAEELESMRTGSSFGCSRFYPIGRARLSGKGRKSGRNFSIDSAILCEVSKSD